MNDFCIVTNGDLALGFKKEEVRKNLAQLCKYDQDTLDQLFSGFPFTFKTGLVAEAADRYKAALDRTGIVCRIEKVLPEIKIEIDKHGSHAISHHPRDPQTLQMICPKCGEQQMKRLTCNSCGVVIEKFNKQQQSAPQIAPAVTSRPNSDKKSSSFLWLLILILLCVVGYFAFTYFDDYLF